MGLTLNLSKNKTFCLSLKWDDYSRMHPICWSFSWTRETDHAGLNLELTLFGCGFELEVHDNRHWNWRQQRWYEVMEEKKLSDEGEELRKKLLAHLQSLPLEEARKLLLREAQRVPALAVKDRYEDVLRSKDGSE